jgi:hypothetical protein
MLVGSIQYTLCSVNAIGVAKVIVRNVYWGTNEMVPQNVRPGDKNVQLSIVLVNVGDDTARSVAATLILEPPLEYTYFQDGKEHTATSISKTAGDIVAGMSFTLAFTLNVNSDAEEGIYHYSLEVSYKSARELQDVKKSYSIEVPIWWGDLLVQEVSTQPAKIYPGSSQVRVTVTIANSGTGIASNVRLWLELKSPFKASSSGSDILILGELRSGQIYPASFIVDVLDNASFGRYYLTLTEERGEKHVPIGEVPLYINEKVKFEVVNVSPTEARVGETGVQIQVTLRNTGSVKAESVRVFLRVGNFFSGTLTDFLGTVLAGEIKVAYFTVDVKSDAQPQQYVFDLRIDWTQEGSSLDDTLRISLNVNPPGTPVVPILLVAVIGIAAAAYFLHKRRKAGKTTSQ